MPNEFNSNAIKRKKILMHSNYSCLVFSYLVLFHLISLFAFLFLSNIALLFVFVLCFLPGCLVTDYVSSTQGKRFIPPADA